MNYSENEDDDDEEEDEDELVGKLILCFCLKPYVTTLGDLDFIFAESCDFLLKNTCQKIIKGFWVRGYGEVASSMGKKATCRVRVWGAKFVSKIVIRSTSIMYLYFPGTPKAGVSNTRPTSSSIFLSLYLNMRFLPSSAAR